MDKATLKVTIASTIVAVAAAGAAFWSSYEARMTRLDSERPFLGVDPQNRDGAKNPIPWPGTPDRIGASDRSAALNVRVRCTAAIKPARWDPGLPSTQTFTFPFILPTHWVSVNCADPSFNPPQSATVVELGTVEYQDDRKNNYLTPFCFYYQFIPVDRDHALDIHQCEDNEGLPNLK